MSTKRTNILIEVPTGLYESVILPCKQNKGLSKLMLSLLEGYRDNPYISSYVEGTLEARQSEALECFDATVSKMAMSLSELGVVTDELGALASEGSSLFEDKPAYKRAHEAGLRALGVSVTPPELQLDLRQDVDDLKRDVGSILSMLTSMVSAVPLAMPVGGGGVVDVVPTEPEVADARSFADELWDLSMELDGGKPDSEGDTDDVLEEEASLPTDEAKKVTNDLLDGMCFEF